MSTVHSGLRHKLRIQFSKNAKLQEKYYRLEKAAMKLREEITGVKKESDRLAVSDTPCSSCFSDFSLELEEIIQEFDEAIKQDEGT